MFLRFTRSLLALSLFILCLHPNPLAAQSAAGSLGIFEGRSDVGSAVPPGTLTYSPDSGKYTIAAAGWDLWSTNDGFHFVWKKLSGDLAFTADIDFPEKTGDHHPFRKAVLMVRQTLDADSAYVDVAQHGSALTALQYRRTQGANTQSVGVNIDSPRRLRLEKRGDTFTMFLSNHGEPLHQVGASIKLHLDGSFYVGIGLSAHNTSVPEKATFSNVELQQLTSPSTPAQLILTSSLQIIEIADNLRRATVLLSEAGRFMAPNWSRNGKALYFTRDGQIYAIPVAGGAPELLDVGNLTKCSGSHGLSPDGKWFAVTCAATDNPDHRVYILPATGGTPRLVAQNTSWFHSWSPDGKTIAFTRGGPHGSGNILSISVDGGPETPLTIGTGLSDDPDYSPDGKWIYFNTDRWGGMQIGRMHPDGSQPEQVTFDEFKNWTPHPSPDGKSIVFISYNPDVTTHAANKDIALRILSTGDNKIRTLVNLIGGDGSMNVPNWSPDSKSLAFVGYQMLPAGDTGSTE
jgi:Tol biopolymer transport system component